MNKKELAESFADKTGTSKKDAINTIEALTELMTEALARGEKIIIPDFGIFDLSGRPEREGRNPRTGEKIRIAASKTVRFKPAKALKESMNH